MEAPGSPGLPPTWSSSAKDMIGTALRSSRLWFTVGYGIVNEIYYPRVDIPQIRDLGFIIAGDEGFWCEVKRKAGLPPSKKDRHCAGCWKPQRSCTMASTTGGILRMCSRVKQCLA